MCSVGVMLDDRTVKGSQTRTASSDGEQDQPRRAPSRGRRRRRTVSRSPERAHQTQHEHRHPEREQPARDRDGARRAWRAHRGATVTSSAARHTMSGTPTSSIRSPGKIGIPLPMPHAVGRCSVWAAGGRQVDGARHDVEHDQADGPQQPGGQDGADGEPTQPPGQRDLGRRDHHEEDRGRKPLGEMLRGSPSTCATAATRTLPAATARTAPSASTCGRATRVGAATWLIRGRRPEARWPGCPTGRRPGRRRR